MTRINLLPPRELVDKHLLAEYRELPRVFGYVRRVIEKYGGEDHEAYVWTIKRQSPTYTMGKGHVVFFYTRLNFLVQRQSSLVEEMQRRSFQARHNRPYELANGFSSLWLGNYVPTPQEIMISRQRIEERLNVNSRL